MYIWSSPAFKPKLFSVRPSVRLLSLCVALYLCRAIYTKLVAIWLATIGRCYYWSHTSGRSVRLYTGECVVDSSTGLWDRATFKVPWRVVLVNVLAPKIHWCFIPLHTLNCGIVCPNRANQNLFKLIEIRTHLPFCYTCNIKHEHQYIMILCSQYFDFYTLGVMQKFDISFIS